MEAEGGLSREEQVAAHRDMLERMPLGSRALCKASGMVSDKRRLVAFIYLVLQECPWTELHVMARQDPSDAAFRDFGAISREVHGGPDDPPDIRVATFLQQLQERFGDDFLVSRMNRLPNADDTDTLFSNGWLASYAQHIAFLLTSR